MRPLAERRVWAFDPRSHRKLLVCDGRVAFTGGVGIAEQWQGDARDVGEWRDTHFRVEGPAVFGLRAAFLDNWIEAVGDFEPTPVCDRPPACPDGGRAQVVASSQRPGWSPAAMALASLLDSARQRLRIATPRFVPRARLLDRLVDAARRGVWVELLLPGERCDARLVRYAGRRVFDRLLAAGVAIWRFEPSMMHQRAVLVDGRAACVGSAGFDPRSTRQDDEVCLLLYDRAVVARLEADFDTDLERSTAVTDSRWRARPWSTRLVEWLTWRLRRRL